MAFNAVAFISGENKLSEREKSLVNRMVDRDALFLVTGSEKKSEILSEYIQSLGTNEMNVIFLHADDSRYLLPYLAYATSRYKLVIDITFAPPYYASVVTLLAMRSGVKITYTQWDGATQVLYISNGPKTEFDEINNRIIKSLISGPKTLTELRDETGQNYKTLARRASALLHDGAISKTDAYPIKYYVTEPQALACQLSSTAYQYSLDGAGFLSAADALFTQDKVILDTTIPLFGEADFDTGNVREISKTPKDPED